jgi:tRNA (guanine-N7-)-methyltransferase
VTEGQHRPIRSFVLRVSRTSIAQQRAVDELLPRFGIEFEPRLLDLDTVFGRQAPRILEIGFGMGEVTAQLARLHPERDYLGVEVHTPGVGNLLKLIDEHGLTNLRIVRHDAVEVLRQMIPVDAFDGVHVFFPDPWPKKRHHKRRLIQPEFVHLLASRIKPGGYLHFATDWEEYATQMLEVLAAEPLLANTTTGFAPRPPSRPQTKFETRGLKLGHDVRDLLFHRR